MERLTTDKDVSEMESSERLTRLGNAEKALEQPCYKVTLEQAKEHEQLAEWLEDYKMVLNEAKSMGCKNIKALYNILLEDMELIVQSLEKQIPKQNDEWISIDERLPDTDNYILLSFSNFTIPVVGRYETDKDGSGVFYIGDELETCLSQDLFVNAWQPLPEPYKESEK